MYNYLNSSDLKEDPMTNNTLKLVVALDCIRNEVCSGISSNGDGAATEKQFKTLHSSLLMIADALNIDEHTMITEWGITKQTWRRWKKGKQYPSLWSLLGREKSLINLIERRTYLPRDLMRDAASEFYQVVGRLVSQLPAENPFPPRGETCGM